MSELGALEKLAIGLTHSRGEAMSLGDDLLVYLLTMAVTHVRKKSNALRIIAERGACRPKSIAAKVRSGL